MLFGSATLEVVIGIIFIFVLVSLIVSAVREGMEAWLKTRAAYLEHGIREMLQRGIKPKTTKGHHRHGGHDAEAVDEPEMDLAREFFEHPLIFGLFSGEYKPVSPNKKPSIFTSGKNLPSYIPSRNFAMALMDIAARGPQTDELSSHPDAPGLSVENIRMNIANLRSPFVQRALLAALDTSKGDIERMQKSLESWYDSAMDRVSGWYKRSTHWALFWIGLAVAILLNINTIAIADYLYKNDAVRKAVVARAENFAKSTDSVQSVSYQQARAALDSLKLPIGWSGGQTLTGVNRAESKGWWVSIWAPLLGWLITALAATMGAPFWFDLLNKVMVIRATVKPHEKSPEEDSEDRQLKPKVTNVAGQAATAAPPASPPSGGVPRPAIAVSNIRDVDSNIDGCDVEFTDMTSDEQLPPAEGGVE